MPRRHTKTLLLTRNFLWIAAAAASAWAQQAPDPLIADPRHTHLDLENQWVRVFEEHLGPHETMPMHQHPAPGAVIVFLTDRNNQLTYFDGTVKTFHNQAGDVIWSAPTVHKSENLTGAEFTAVQIEPRPVVNSQPFPKESMDAVTVDPAHYQVMAENEWIRAIRLTVGPHEKLKMHKHPATGAVVVYLTDQDMRQYHADGTSRESHYKAGTVRWVPPDAAHQDENLSDKPFRLVRIELKQAEAVVAEVVAEDTRIRILCSNGIRAAVEKLLPDYERGMGRSMKVQFAEGTGVDLAGTGIGIAVRAGLPKPDLTKREAIKQMLLRSKSIGCVKEGASTPAIVSMLNALGISEDVQRKTVFQPGAERSMASVAEGQIDVAFALISEILPAPGVQLAGPFPPEFQKRIIMTAGISSSTRNRDVASEIIQSLTSAAAAATIKATGLDPVVKEK